MDTDNLSDSIDIRMETNIKYPVYFLFKKYFIITGNYLNNGRITPSHNHS